MKITKRFKNAFKAFNGSTKEIALESVARFFRVTWCK